MGRDLIKMEIEGSWGTSPWPCEPASLEPSSPLYEQSRFVSWAWLPTENDYRLLFDLHNLTVTPFWYQTTLAVRCPSDPSQGESGGFPPRRESSYEAPSEASQRVLGCFPPGEKAHTKARAKWAQQHVFGSDQFITISHFLYIYVRSTMNLDRCKREHDPTETWLNNLGDDQEKITNNQQ